MSLVPHYKCTIFSTVVLNTVVTVTASLNASTVCTHNTVHAPTTVLAGTQTLPHSKKTVPLPLDELLKDALVLDSTINAFACAHVTLISLRSLSLAFSLGKWSSLRI